MLLLFFLKGAEGTGRKLSFTQAAHRRRSAVRGGRLTMRRPGTARREPAPQSRDPRSRHAPPPPARGPRPPHSGPSKGRSAAAAATTEPPLPLLGLQPTATEQAPGSEPGRRQSSGSGRGWSREGSGDSRGKEITTPQSATRRSPPPPPRLPGQQRGAGDSDPLTPPTASEEKAFGRAASPRTPAPEPAATTAEKRTRFRHASPYLPAGKALPPVPSPGCAASRSLP